MKECETWEGGEKEWKKEKEEKAKRKRKNEIFCFIEITSDKIDTLCEIYNKKREKNNIK